MDTKKALTRAKQLLLQHGWCQKAFKNEAGAMCLFRAINLAVQESPSFTIIDLGEVINKLERVLEDRNITKWNDVPGRTVDEVLAVLDAAMLK